MDLNDPEATEEARIHGIKDPEDSDSGVELVVELADTTFGSPKQDVEILYRNLATRHVKVLC